VGWGLQDCQIFQGILVEEQEVGREAGLDAARGCCEAFGSS